LVIQITEQPTHLNHTYIEDNIKLLSYLRHLEDKKISAIALDIEAENNLHAYGQKLCLIQVFDGNGAVLIDPFKIAHSTLKSLFENRDILKVMYGSPSDLELLKNALNIQLKSVLDLYPAVMLLNFEKQDLHSVIGTELGITLNNKSKFQTHNWTLRPISKPALDYAVNDVLHLLKLKESLFEKLAEKKLLDSYFLRNLKVQNKDYTRRPGIKYSRFAGYQYLPEQEKAVAERVINTIDKYAASYNMPFDSLFRKTDVVEIIKDPSYLVKVRFPKRLSESSVQEIKHELLRILKEPDAIRENEPALSKTGS
jgi:ribonuclease D